MNTKIEGFNINDWLKDLPVQTNSFTEVDGEVITEHYKELHIGDHIRLYLCGETGQANLIFHDCGDGTFLWDAEMERIFSNIDSIDIAELFTAMYKRRWVGIYG